MTMHGGMVLHGGGARGLCCQAIEKYYKGMGDILSTQDLFVLAFGGDVPKNAFPIHKVPIDKRLQ